MLRLEIRCPSCGRSFTYDTSPHLIDGFIARCPFEDCQAVIHLSNINDINKEKHKRGKVLYKALETINGERQDSYGNPEFSFDIIAAYWKIYWQDKDISKIDSHDVCMMMTLFKIAREQVQKKPDNIVDACGYLGIAGDLQGEKK